MNECDNKTHRTNESNMLTIKRIQTGPTRLEYLPCVHFTTLHCTVHSPIPGVEAPGVMTPEHTLWAGPGDVHLPLTNLDCGATLLEEASNVKQSEDIIMLK